MMVFWGCNELKEIIYYGQIEPTYINDNYCFLYEIQNCGNETHPINCSPFNCKIGISYSPSAFNDVCNVFIVGRCAI